MPKKLQITVRIKDDNGDSIVESTDERAIPYIEEIDSQGFKKSFDQLETAVLEARKNTSDQAVTEYLDIIAKKKLSAK
jgi:hypothetical protein